VALLDGGETNLLEAALEAGFGSYSHFHRVFRAQLHATPRAYLRPSNGNHRNDGIRRRRAVDRGQ
jgi:AraC-like DNA-binding protein